MDISSVSSGASNIARLALSQNQSQPASKAADNDGDEATESAAQKAAERGGVDIKV